MKETGPIQIREYQPGDDDAQAEIYNSAIASLPAFKPASADEIARRYRSPDAQRMGRFYAVEGSRVLGYIAFNPNGRISYPWCLPEAQALRSQLLDAALAAMRGRGLADAWAAYRSDWREVIDFLEQHGFQRRREMINYVAAVARLPRHAEVATTTILPLSRVDVPAVARLGHDLFATAGEDLLAAFLLDNPYFDPKSAYVLRQTEDEQILGAALAIVDQRFADPAKLDAAMPCFRLGAFGTETERHKRVSGMFSCVFDSVEAGDALLAEAARRFESAGLTHAAAQAPSDQPQLVAFYDRHFERQGSFPILARRLD